MSEESRSEFRKMNKTAFVVGYTGGAGKALLAELVESNLYQKLLLLGRRKVDLPENENYAKTVCIVLFLTIFECAPLVPLANSHCGKSNCDLSALPFAFGRSLNKLTILLRTCRMT